MITPPKGPVKYVLCFTRELRKVALKTKEKKLRSELVGAGSERATPSASSAFSGYPKVADGTTCRSLHPITRPTYTFQLTAWSTYTHKY